MKYRTIIILLCLVLFCSACRGITPPAADTTNPTAPQVATDPTDPEPTDPPSAPIDPEPEIPLWYNQDPQYLSYEEFFGSNRVLSSSFSNGWWYVRHGDTFIKVGFGFQNDFVIKSGETEYQIPGSENLTGYTRISSSHDGHYFYMNSSTDIIRVDLFTGKTETIYTCDRLLKVHCYGDLVLMFLAENDGVWNIYRTYLPTLDTEVFCEGIPTDTPLHWFGFSRKYATQEPFVWTMMNPEMATLLRKEFANPNSIYKINDFTGYKSDYSSIWGKLALEPTDQYRTPPYCLIHEVQTHSGIHTWLKCAYDPADGSCKKTTGIIDTCWYGSGYSHDHYDPKEYDISPFWKVSEAEAITNISLPKDPQKMYEEDLSACTNTDYAYINGFLCRKTAKDVFQILFEIDLKAAITTPDYLYGITPENALVQVSYDGTVRNTIYSADGGTLSELLYGSGKLYFLENESTLMEIDIPAKACRSLLEIPYCSNMYLDDPNVLFFENARGMTVGMYIADFSKMTLKETHRL